ncbi:MAG: hypothetical protein KDJ16_13760 [Hyphomicrobiales bacterium]|nr:hypothetical protein [Hyphomicrobiales bacterium]
MAEQALNDVNTSKTGEKTRHSNLTWSFATVFAIGLALFGGSTAFAESRQDCIYNAEAWYEGCKNGYVDGCHQECGNICSSRHTLGSAKYAACYAQCERACTYDRAIAACESDYLNMLARCDYLQ